MKKTNRFIAMAAALTLTASAMIPMFAFADDTPSITITGISSTNNHTFEIYQIFTGDYDSATDVLTNLKWGADVTKYGSKDVTVGTTVDKADAEAIAAFTDAGTLPSQFTYRTGTTEKPITTITSSNGTATKTGLAAGYYVVKDITNLDNKDDANSAWIVQIAGTTSIAIKTQKPTVDKQILDETGDAELGATDGWGESADHAINEPFKFKLIADIPDDANFKEYSSYQIVFDDTMSAGVTYESIESVKISSESLTGDNVITLTSSDYSTTGLNATSKAGLNWTLTINDVKALVDNKIADTGSTTENPKYKKLFGSEEIKVEVIYNAHLNENAVVDTASRADGTSTNTNNNKVFLKYSNNPDGTGAGTGLGQTPEDYVWAYTYVENNVKYANEVKSGNELAGAKFKLYKGDYTTGTPATTDEIKLIYDTNFTSAGNINGYRPIATGETATDMESATDGKFDIIGLDAGTYTLIETEAPDKYVAVAPIKFTIEGTHKEQSTGDKVDLTLTGLTAGVENNIVDTFNQKLPETGGIGTTLFYIGGGCMAGVAGILLITKKRAKNANN